MNAYAKRLQRLESRRKPAGDASQMTLGKLQMLIDLGETQAVARWPQAGRVFALLRLAQERRKNRG